MTSIYSEAGGKGDYDITGEVLVGVYYKNGQLYIHVERARGLAAADSNGYSDPYIKTYLLPDKAKHTKQKTSVKKKTLSPVYNETLKVKKIASADI
jgi:Ca2+-dependent lipid-binding protein